MRAKDIRPAEDDRDGERVQDEGTDEVAAQFVVGAGISAVLELGGYGRVLTSLYLAWIGWVTMLMLVMPACLTASITEANAPKGTRSSARR